MLPERAFCSPGSPSRAAVTLACLLSTAELRVLRLLPTHLSLAQIADELVVSRNMVKSQVAAIYRTFGAANEAGGAPAR
jgi:DNA-binding NarL/FixJ family response regulator